MTDMLTRDEARERSALLEVAEYAVRLDLSAAADPDTATFETRTTVEFEARRQATTFIDLIAPHVHSVTVNGRTLDPAEAFDGSRIALPVDAGPNVVTIRADAAYSRSGEGLHRFTDPADGRIYLYTQFEPTDARRVFANFDQPDLKARFSFTVLAPDDFTVLSNTTEIPAPDEVAPAGTALHAFAPTLRQSSYITCIAAGHYASVRGEYVHPATGEAIPLGVHARASLAADMEADEILDVTRAGLDFFHDLFDVPYPWGKYDQIFVPEYNLGAMENPGLVTFTDSLIFRDRVTRSMHESRAGVILHEMAHMWFGDLVTMAWWDDLWLKESFADYMGTLALAEATEFSDAWVTFALRRKDWAYRQDQYPTTHPIIADVPDVEAARLNFDGITYAKGASALKQLVAFVGREAFVAGSRRYFRTHAFDTARLDDFLDALAAEAPHRDVHGWADAWLRTTGVSEISLDVAPDAEGRIGDAWLHQRSTDGETIRPHRLALAAFSRSGPRLEPQGTWGLDFAVADCDLPEIAGEPMPDLLLLNHGDHDFCKVRLDERSTATALRGVSRLADPLDRALVWSALVNAMRDGLLPVPDFLRAHARALSRETHPGIAASLRTHMLTALDRWTDPAVRDAALEGMLGSALDALSGAPAGGDAQLDLADTVLALVKRTASPGASGPASVGGREFAAAILATPVGSALSGDLAAEAKGLVCDHALRWKALIALVCLGWADTDDIEAQAAADPTGSGAMSAATARASRPLAIVKMRAFTDVGERTDLSNDLLSARISGLMNPSGLPLGEPFVDVYFAHLERWWRDRSPEIAKRLVIGLYPHDSRDGRRVLALTDAWLAEHGEASAGLRRLLVEARSDLDRAVTLRTAD